MNWMIFGRKFDWFEQVLFLVGVGTACGTDMEQIFAIHLFRSEPLNF